MSVLTKETYKTTYSNTSGTFADNTSRQISEGDLRQFAEDTADSFKSETSVVGNAVFLIEEIGDWDMDTNASASAWNTGITIDKFVSATFSVIPDVGVALQQGYQLGADAGLSIIVGLAGPNIVITPGRAAASIFDSTDFNATSFNRGYITLCYLDS